MASEKVRPKKGKPDYKNWSYEKLKEAVMKKKECNAKAQKVVESLIEGEVDEERFSEHLKHINRNHYEDVIEERAISRQCGYPVCSNMLGNIPKQQYHISTVHNQVYDITERKNFCSNHCYKASVYVKNQLLTSPLWMRDAESVQEILLLSSDTNKEKRNEAVYVGQDTLLDVRRYIRNIDLEKEQIDSSIDVIQREIEDINKLLENRVVPETGPTDSDVLEALETGAQPSDGENEEKPKLILPTVKERTEMCEIQSTSIKTNSASKSERKASKNVVNPIRESKLRVESSLEEWFTVDSLRYLKGELKQLDAEEECNTYRIEHYEKYVNLCRKLKILEIEDEQFDRSVNFADEKRPIPDYSKLKAETKNMELKVRAFFNSEFVIRNEEEQDVTENGSFLLPSTHHHAQNSLRRRIVFDKLRNSLTNVAIVCGIGPNILEESVKMLLQTFNFSAHNITFRLQEWNLISIILVRLLSIKDEEIKEQCSQEQVQERLASILEFYQLEKGYLDSICSRITDVRRLNNSLNETK